MGPVPISRAVNAVALCNRMRDSQMLQSGHDEVGGGVNRLAFVPSIRVYVKRTSTSQHIEQHEDQSEQTEQQEQRDVIAAPRRTMQLHLRLVSHAAREPRADEDVIRVSSKTDVVRLGG